MIYGKEDAVAVPNLDLLTFLFESEYCTAREDSPIYAEAEDPANSVLNKSQARLLTKQIAHFLRHQYGIGKNGPGKDVVISIAGGQSRLPCMFFGVVAAGGVYSAIGHASMAAGLGQLIRDTGLAKVLVCDGETKELAVGAAAEAGLRPSDVLVLESHPELRLGSADGGISCDFAAFENVLDWKAVTNPEELGDTAVCLIYSSGTTAGSPKGILISHTNMVSEAFLPADINRRVWAEWSKSGNPNAELPPLGNGYRTLAHLPPAHISGIQGYFVNPFLDGGLVYWTRGFDMVKFLRYNETLKITTFFTAPPIYAGIAKLHQHRPGFITSKTFQALRVAYSGGTTLQQHILEASGVHNVLGDPEHGKPLLISQTWGATETTGAVTHMPPNRAGWDTLGSVGALLPGVLMRLVDDNGQDVPPGTPGEALIKGLMVMKGYHENPEADRAVFTEDGWFRTGDIVKFEGDLLYYVDRKQDVIRDRGFQIFPSELEHILLSHSFVADVAVIGVPRTTCDDGDGDRLDEIPRAFVVLSPQDVDNKAELLTGATAQELVDFVKTKVDADHKQLAGGVEFVNAIPRAPAGKILRRDLQKLCPKILH